jgi:hypothetical protein
MKDKIQSLIDQYRKIIDDQKHYNFYGESDYYSGKESAYESVIEDLEELLKET